MGTRSSHRLLQTRKATRHKMKRGGKKFITLSYVHQYRQIRRLVIQDPNVYQPRKVFWWALSGVFYPILLPCQPLPSKRLDYMKDIGIRIYGDRNKPTSYRTAGIKNNNVSQSPRRYKKTNCSCVREEDRDGKMHRHQVP